MSDIERKAREALERLRPYSPDERAAISAALDELGTLKAARERFNALSERAEAAEESVYVLQTAVDILKADLADARRERDEQTQRANEAVDRNIEWSNKVRQAKRERDEARGLVGRWLVEGSALRAERDDARRERDEAHAKADYWHELTKDPKRFEADYYKAAKAVNDRVTAERDEARALLLSTSARLVTERDALRAEHDEAVRLLREADDRLRGLGCETQYPMTLTRVALFLSKFPERPIDQTAEGATPHVSDAEPAKESEPRCHYCTRVGREFICEECAARFGLRQEKP